MINEESRWAMKEALHNIQTGEYAKKFILEGMANYPEMTAMRPAQCRAPHRAGGREAARDDALDQGQRPGRQEQELNFLPG